MQLSDQPRSSDDYISTQFTGLPLNLRMHVRVKNILTVNCFYFTTFINWEQNYY